MELQFRTGVHSQQFVADRIHVDRSTYAHMESGRSPILSEVLCELAEILSAPPCSFLSPSTAPAREETREPADDGETRVIAFYRGLPDVGQQEAQGYLEYLHMKHIANAPAEDEGTDETV